MLRSCRDYDERFVAVPNNSSSPCLTNARYLGILNKVSSLDTFLYLMHQRLVDQCNKELIRVPLKLETNPALFPPAFPFCRSVMSWCFRI